MKRILIGSAALFSMGLFYFFTWGARHIDQLLNLVARPPHCEASRDAKELHQRLLIADLHCDLLLWQRDPLAMARYGHVDVPRLIKGNVTLQVFSVVTKVPWGMNYERNSGVSDITAPLVVAQRWPMGTWFGLRERALYQARRFHSAVARSQGKLVFIGSAGDLKNHIERRRRDPDAVAGILSVEGLHALEGELANVNVLYRAGFRMMAPSHFFDNEVGGSAHGLRKGGLTMFGRRVIARMEELNIIVDLAHASPRMTDDILAMVTRPVVVSHTGVRGTCESLRNLNDQQIVRIARSGGVVGIGFWQGAVCGNDVTSIVRAISYVADLVGVDHVALGSDFDGATRTPLDAAGLVCMTEALSVAGFTESDVYKIMGGNTLRLLMEALPDGVGRK
ncbi:MAG: dipeptidase [Candidatus Krumholzibacteria bacterium]|nr:dipeptidase [Candidatus Krumholzibacteria bacterium]